MESDRTLVVLAAGRGRRFGGAKQTDAIGPAGEWLLEYALFDARRSGFDRAVVVVHPAAEASFRTRLEGGAGRVMACELADPAEARRLADRSRRRDPDAVVRDEATAGLEGA